VPAQSGGGSFLWQRAAARWGLLAGADLNHAEGWSRERLFPAGSRLGGGTQTQYGLFAQGNGSLGPLRAFGGLRRHMTGSREFWSPSGGLTADIRNLRLRASAYRAFRAPTLNELYRDFRVGNTLTRANSALLPESLHGYEAGGDLRFRRATLSATAFRSELRDLIANVTLASTPVLITRQRQNVAAARTQGIELSARSTWRGFLAEAAYLFSDSRFSSGFRVPQVPKHSGSFQLTWSREGTLLSGGLRSTSMQFEDDVNRFLLPGYAVWHAAGRQAIKGPFALHITVENAANRQYSAGFSPTPLLGAPRLIRAGVAWDLSR
jgi:outer membrane receptor protein involved in Fe transport